MNNLAIFCADVGSIKNGNFGWAATLPGNIELTGTDIGEFASEIAKQVKRGSKVAIGYECPLFVPVRKDPVLVNSSRNGEGSRSWSAGAGTGALATGLVEVIWVFNKLAELLEKKPAITFDWEEFKAKESIFLWEAFVTSTSKGKDHADDAKIALATFMSAMPDPRTINAINETEVFSLAGAAILRTGWSDNISLLHQPCLVIKA
jgi:hypothetical protein